MKIRGTLLTFNKIYGLNPHMFTKDTKFTIPEKIPFTWNFNAYDPESILGDVKAFVTEEGISIEGDIFNESILKYIEPSWGLGGFYSRVRHHEKDDISIIDEAAIAEVAMVPNPISDDLKFVIGGKLEAFKEDQ